MLGLHRLTQSWEVTANPWHPLAPPALPSLSPAAPRPGAMGRPRHPSTGAGGTPRLGIPGTYLAVPAPRPPACVPSHRGSAALCLVKPIMHRLYSSPSPQHPLLPRSSAWHGPGAQGVPWQRVGGHGRSKPSLRGSLRLCTSQSSPSWGMSKTPRGILPQIPSLVPRPSLGGSLPCWPRSSQPTLR